MTITALIGAFNAVSSFSLALFVFLKNPRNNKNIAYLFFGLAVALYSVGYYLWGLAASDEKALFAFKVLTSGIILINSAYLHFVFSLLGKTKEKRKILYLCHLTNIIFVVLNLNLVLYHEVEKKSVWGYWPNPNPLFYLYFIIWFLQLIYGLLHLYQGYRRTTGQRSTQIKYVFFSTLIGYVGGGTNWLPWFDISFPPHLNILVSVYVAILAYAIVRHKLLDIEVVIKKTLVFSGLFAMVMAVVAFVTTLTRDLIAQAFQVSTYFSTALSAFIAVVLYGPTHRFLVNATDRFLFQKGESIKEVLRRLSERIITILDLGQVARTILETFEESLRAESGAIILKNQSGYSILQSYGINGPAARRDYPQDDSLIEYFRNRKRLIYVEDEGTRKKLPVLFLARLENLRAVVTVPLFLHGELIGLLTLGKKKSDQEYTAEEIDYFPTVAGQVAIALSNARLYHESIEARKKIEEMQLELIHREKMAFVADLVKGIAHEVFNPLTPVFHAIEVLEGSVFVKLVNVLKTQETKMDQEASGEYLKALEELREVLRGLKVNTQHIFHVVDTLNKMQKEDKETIGPVDLKTFLKDSTALIGMELHGETREIPIVEEVPRGLPPMKGNPTLLTQVFVNLFKNSVHAMEGRTEKKITIRAALDPENPRFLRVDFSDRGSGIQADILPKVFDFGFTTKKGEGQGIGLSQCRLIVEKFGGSLSCSSKVGEGATFTLKLPIWGGGQN